MSEIIKVARESNTPILSVSLVGDIPKCYYL